MRTWWARRSARASSKSRSASSTRATSSRRKGSSRTSSSRRSATSSAKRPSRPRCARGSSLTAASCGSTACRTRSSCSCDPRLRRPVRGSSGLAPATQDPLGVLLEHQRVLAHEGVADDPQEDAEARETGDGGEEGDQWIAEWPPGREDRPREPPDEAEQTHAQPESQEEPTPSDSAPREMESVPPETRVGRE